jgi:hypothetical protein
LVQKVRKKFWNLWRKFKKRRWEPRSNSSNQHDTKQLFKKNKKFYDFLKETDFCSFNQFEKSLQNINDQEILESTLNFSNENPKGLFKKKEFQLKFAEMMHVCFGQDVRMMNLLNL